MGGLYSALTPLSDLFFAVLKFLHESLGVSWSWSIVLLTVIVRVVLIPLTWRQIKSMRAMQALQPQIKALQEKYKSDRQLLNQKTMEFYQENKVSPFGSCLPLLLQLPVFFGLYIMLRNAGLTPKSLGGTGVGNAAGAFLTGDPVGWLWISNITKFDIILMFLYIASQFVASWQTARNSPSQQKMIAYFMPIIVGIFMFMGKWPAGLFIYWFTSNLWTIAQQFVAEKVMPVHMPVVVAAPVKEKVPTKAKAAPARPVGKSGGKTSGQKTGQQGKASGSTSKRPDRGTGRPKGSGRT
jgi:YidC/Oxa1 family membrane protein insertase